LVKTLMCSHGYRTCFAGWANVHSVTRSGSYRQFRDCTVDRTLGEMGTAKFSGPGPVRLPQDTK